MTGLRWRIVATAATCAIVALAVIAASPLRPEGGAGLSLLTPALVAAVIAGILSMPLSELAVRGLTRSVDHIADGAREIARGGEPPTAEPFWDDELIPLATALRDMAGALTSQIHAGEAERARLAAILAHMGDGVIMVDVDGRIALINTAAARLLGTSPEAAEGHSLVDVARDHELVAAARRPLTRTPPDAPVLLELGTPRRTVQVVATAVPAEGREQARTLLLLQDVSDLRRAESIRREFVANVSHELRTPVASLKALAETLDSGALEDPPAARLFLARMLLEVDRLAQLVEELLELALLESGAVTLAHEPVDLAEIVPRAAERLHANADRHDVELIVEESPASAVVLGDALRLEQVLVNLIDNAVKFTPAGGQVRVCCETTDGQVQLAVQDTGTGIPTQDLARVFERFYKADRARASAGTGLGLAIAKHTVDAHGGHIWVESTEGTGSTFFVSIPAATPGAPAPRPRLLANDL